MSSSFPTENENQPNRSVLHPKLAEKLELYCSYDDEGKQDSYIRAVGVLRNEGKGTVKNIRVGNLGSVKVKDLDDVEKQDIVDAELIVDLYKLLNDDNKGEKLNVVLKYSQVTKSHLLFLRRSGLQFKGVFFEKSFASYQNDHSIALLVAYYHDKIRAHRNDEKKPKGEETSKTPETSTGADNSTTTHGTSTDTDNSTPMPGSSTESPKPTEKSDPTVPKGKGKKERKDENSGSRKPNPSGKPETKNPKGKRRPPRSELIFDGLSLI